MNVSTLILELQKFQEENGDLQVRVNADHGQTPMAVCNVGTGYIDEDTYSPRVSTLMIGTVTVLRFVRCGDND
jgi:hypothetical protein